MKLGAFFAMKNDQEGIASTYAGEIVWFSLCHQGKVIDHPLIFPQDYPKKSRLCIN